jgi:hypothetical protein
MPQIKKLAYGFGDNPIASPMSSAAPPGASVVKTPPVTATPPVVPVANTTPAPAPTVPASTTAPKTTGGWMDSVKTTAGDLLGKAKNFTTGLMGDQVSRAGTHYALSRAQGQNPLQAGLGAFGQLDTSIRGIGGGALGLLGSGMLSPAGSRGYTMPLAGGLGAMLATANGPDGFKWENMLKPEALMAGGLGAGAGWLGSKFLGDGDDEEEDPKLYDPAGLHRRRSGGGSSWLPALAGVGALGLGAYGLHKYMQPSETAPVTNKELMLPPAPPAAAPPSPVAGAPAPPIRPVPGVTPGASGPDQALVAAQNDPQNLLNNIQRMQEMGMAPGPRQSLGNLVGNFHQVESGVGNTNGMPRTSDVYRRIYDGQATPEEAARAPKFIDALDAAKQVASGTPFEGLQRAEALRNTPLNNNIPHDVQQNSTGFPIKGMEALGAFGVKDLTHLSDMAAKGDPVVPQVLHAMGPEAKRELLSTLTTGGYSKFQPAAGNEVQFSAAASNPRSAALLGALQSASTGKGIEPEPYDTKAFLQDSNGLRGALRPGQKVQLIQDIGGNLETFVSKFKELSPDEQRTAAKNLAGLLSRTAYSSTVQGETTPTEVPGYLDTNAQKAVARLVGNRDYKTINPSTWRELASQGLDSSGSLSPYADPANKKLRTAEDLELRQGNPPAGYSPADITLKQSPAADKQVVNEWSQLIKDHYLNKSVIPDNNTGPMVASLQTLRESRPDLYRAVVRSLQSDPDTAMSGLVSNKANDWEAQLANIRGHGNPFFGDQPNAGLDLTTGRRFNNSGKPIPAQGPPMKLGPIGNGWETAMGGSF